MRRKLIIAACLLPTVASARADGVVTGVRFGILKAMGDGCYAVRTETTRLPLRLKDTGFRFGIAFDNPRCEEIEWHELLRLPAQAREVTGNMRRAGARVLKTKPTRSAQARVVDEFWFDPGDPLGKHRMELIVNGKSVHTVDFEVVAST